VPPWSNWPVSSPATSADRRRQVGVTVAEVLCVVGTLVGVGALGGTPVQEAAGGALAADATLIAPAGPAFAIWTPIYLGLAAYAVWQWLPEQATDRRHRAIGWLVAASMLLNATWLLVIQAGWLWVSVLVIAALAATLALLLLRLDRNRSYGFAESVVVDGTFGLYLGWVAVAACANVTAALVSAGVDLGGVANALAAVVVLAVAAAVGWWFAVRLGGRWAVAVAMAWGLGWVAWGRLAAEPSSALVGLAALVAATVVVAGAVRMHSRLDV
jgi:hypothetical protein